MDAMRIAIASMALLAATSAHADPIDRWRPLIADASARFGVPVAWIAQVMRTESGGRTLLNGHPIISPAGAMGLMQLMPTTWSDMRARLGLGSDPYAPRDNILAGAYYLRLLYDRFGYPGLFAAYNAGPRRYADHLATGRALPSETRTYLASVIGVGTSMPIVTGSSSQAGLFLVRHDQARVPAGPSASTALFAHVVPSSSDE